MRSGVRKIELVRLLRGLAPEVTMGNKGFSLIEMMICLVILSILVIILVPSLKEVKMSANETWAVTYMRSWVPSQEMFKLKSTVRRYADSDEQLIRGGFLGAPDPGGSDPRICGYTFEIRASELPDRGATYWEGYARPIALGTTGRYGYFISSKDCMIRYSESGSANGSSPPLQN
jgi:prepilin-type N-terminal cleavage/methylation domain-containing protein